jgi:LSD1 subclass zinc finger protein
MAHTTKQNNNHKRHETQCQECGRMLPRQAYKVRCASCFKHERGLEHIRMAVGVRPGLVTVYRWEWKAKVAA